MSHANLPASDEAAYRDWLARVLIEDGSSVATEPRPDQSCAAKVPARFIRRAVLDHNSNSRPILSGIQARDMHFEGDFNFSNLEIGFPLFFNRCIFEGAVIGNGAKTRSLGFTGSELRLGADLRNVEVDGHLFLRGPFVAAGPILLRDAKVEGTIDLSGGRFLYDGCKPDGPFAEAAAGDCIGLSRAQAAALLWSFDSPPGTAPHRDEVAQLRPRGLVTLRDLSVRAFRHDLDSNGLDGWPDAGRLVLNGFTYERIADAPCQTMLDWIGLQRDHSPAPYFQLASVLAKQGRKEDAVRIRAQVRRNEVGRYEQPKRFFAWALFAPIGYGASPRWALYDMLGLFAIFLVAIVVLDRSGGMAPSAESLIRDPCYYGWQKCGDDLKHWRRMEIASSPPTVRFIPPDYPALSPVEYALESFAPFFDFRQRRNWEAASAPIRGVLALVAFLGLFFGSLFAAALTGLLKPPES